MDISHLAHSPEPEGLRPDNAKLFGLLHKLPPSSPWTVLAGLGHRMLEPHANGILHYSAAPFEGFFPKVLLGPDGQHWSRYLNFTQGSECTVTKDGRIANIASDSFISCASK